MNALAWPAVIVRGPRDVALALVPGRPVTLLSAPGAAAFGGPSWWAALAAHARRVATSGVGDLLDAGNAPGLALAAFRCGCRDVALAPCPAWDAVAAVATETGARLHAALPPSLDLGLPASAHRLAAWLDGDTTRSLP